MRVNFFLFYLKLRKWIAEVMFLRFLYLYFFSFIGRKVRLKTKVYLY